MVEHCVSSAKGFCCVCCLFNYISQNAVLRWIRKCSGLSCYTKNQVKENSHAKPEQVSFLFKCAIHSFQRYNKWRRGFSYSTCVIKMRKWSGLTVKSLEREKKGDPAANPRKKKKGRTDNDSDKWRNWLLMTESGTKWHQFLAIWVHLMKAVSSGVLIQNDLNTLWQQMILIKRKLYPLF